MEVLCAVLTPSWVATVGTVVVTVGGAGAGGGHRGRWDQGLLEHKDGQRQNAGQKVFSTLQRPCDFQKKMKLPRYTSRLS